MPWLPFDLNLLIITRAVDWMMWAGLCCSPVTHTRTHSLARTLDADAGFAHSEKASPAVSDSVCNTGVPRSRLTLCMSMKARGSKYQKRVSFSEDEDEQCWKEENGGMDAHHLTSRDSSSGYYRHNMWVCSHNSTNSRGSLWADWNDAQRVEKAQWVILIIWKVKAMRLNRLCLWLKYERKILCFINIKPAVISN